MTLSKAEKFRFLSGGIFEPSTGSLSQASTTNANAGWDTPLDSNDGFAQETKLASAAAEARMQVVPASVRPPDAKLGQPAPPELSFCPVQAVAKYPYKHIRDKTLQDAVSSSFFAGGRFFERDWNIFYIYPPPDISSKPLLLLSLVEVRSFIETINEGTCPPLKIPPRSDDCGFQVCFSEMGPQCRPRYLGKSTCRDDFQHLESAVPSPTFKPDDEISSPLPSQRTLAAFKRIMELAQEATKNKSKAAKAKKQKERVEKQRGWGRQIKRTQRYLGLRQRQDGAELGQVFGQEPKIDRPPLDVTLPAPYEMENSVVFVSIDVESFERDHKKITEIGISVLDTNNLNGIPPGEGGREWMKQIRTRHLRVKEHAHLHNKDFVTGCAERFEFGESEWVTMKEAPLVVAECFRFPPEGHPPRNIIILGHDVYGDIDYLKLLGYNPLNLPNLAEILDTSIMHRFLKREQNPRSLGSVLVDLDIMGWNLHNAGNDAAYTLQAMLALAIKAETDKGIDWAEEQRKRVSEAAKEAMEKALQLGEGWSSGGEDSDGGVAEKPPRAGKGSLLGQTEGDGGNWGGRRNEGNGVKNGNRNRWEDGQKNGREGEHNRQRAAQKRQKSSGSNSSIGHMH